jgi:hypothetical protein
MLSPVVQNSPAFFAKVWMLFGEILRFGSTATLG